MYRYENIYPRGTLVKSREVLAIVPFKMPFDLRSYLLFLGSIRSLMLFGACVVNDIEDYTDYFCEVLIHKWR